MTIAAVTALVTLYNSAINSSAFNCCTINGCTLYGIALNGCTVNRITISSRTVCGCTIAHIVGRLFTFYYGTVCSEDLNTRSINREIKHVNA